MPDGFAVDVEALKNAGLGLSDLLGDLDELQVENIDCDRKFIGHTKLADSYESFTTRWALGVENLTKGGQHLSRRLVDAAGAYSKADQAHEHKLKGIFDDTGADPRRDGDERWLNSARRMIRRSWCPARPRRSGRRPCI
ncbi:hypothetical protein VA596_04285 [Amycolatopsis sp., V23-08]|uniref:ESX-1 secretion-associated protein n=1 Tax=Amycolatopsis heterodermiae TaxID=3110235 RepID=A0ABU5QXY7_9PSEU|nr:hypothetical protein [Amycolatopsis sp., V23-08]MEA5358743.1 hypothetical protein [Amycolatopsis sp., V23-08]